MQLPVLESTQLTYLRACRKLAAKKDPRMLGSYEVAKELTQPNVAGSSLEENRQLEDQLIYQLLLEEVVNQPDTIRLTDRGKWCLHAHSWYLGWAFSAYRFYQKHMAGFIRQKGPVILYAVLLFGLFIWISPKLNDQLNELVVKPLLISFAPSYTFDLAFTCLALWLIWRNMYRKIGTWDILVALLYVHYRFNTPRWGFIVLFSHGEKITGLPAYIDVLVLYYLAVFVYWLYDRRKRKQQFAYEYGLFYPDYSLEKQAHKTRQTLAAIDSKGLNRLPFASQLAEVISQMVPFEAFAIGICGPWGSGKSSLIQLTLEQLRKIPTKKEYLIVEFAPWFFPNSETLIANFFSMLEKKFRNNRFLVKELRAYSKQLVMLEKSLFKTEWSSTIFEKQAGLKERYDSIVESLEAEGKILVVSVDDLDRLDNKEIVDVLRLIRLIANFPNTIYLVAYDRGYITAAIEKELSQHNAGKYLDKVVNIEFKIPELSASKLRQRLEEAVLEKIKTVKNIGTVDQAELKICFEYQDTVHIIRHERDIKRFTNNLLMRYLAIRQEINFYHFYLLELLYFHNQDVYAALYLHRLAISNSYRTFLADNDRPEIMDFANLLQTPQLDSLSAGLLNTLYSRTAFRDRYALNNELYFVRYFSLSLMGDFSNADFDKALHSSAEELRTNLAEFYGRNPTLLGEKLHYLLKEKRFEPANTPAFINFFDGLLGLYPIVFFARPIGSDPSLNGNSLHNYIFELLVGSNSSVSLFKDRVTALDMQDYQAIAYLSSTSSLSILNKHVPATDLQIWHDELKQTSIVLLDKLKRQHGEVINETIITQFHYLRDFAVMPGYKKINQNRWYADKVISPNKSYLLGNLKVIIEYCKKNAFENKQFMLSKMMEQIDMIFHSTISNVYAKPEFEILRDAYRGYDTIVPSHGYTFSANGRLQNKERPDSNYKVLPFNRGDRIEMKITPMDQMDWAVGFRLGRTQDSVRALPADRHTGDNQYITLVKGKADGAYYTNVKPDLLVQVWRGPKVVLTKKLIGPYQNTEFTFGLEKVELEKIHVEAMPDADNINEIQPIDELHDYNWIEISAWSSDPSGFTLTTHLKVLRSM